MTRRRDLPAPDDGMDRDWAVVLREAVELLPPRQHRVLVLRYVHDLTLAEIARREGISKGAVQDALGRAHAQLRRLLKRT
jgi:RNA polymerase sigma factor (sigma-70 family)